MIRIDKLPKPKNILRSAQSATQKHCGDYDQDPGAYRSGSKRFKFRKIYGTKAVKKKLKDIQKDKCCYCEGRFDAQHAGDVDHYRPKGVVHDGAATVRPGYYWLAYEWTNLYYACADCNEYRKRAIFPVAAGTRCLDHHGDLARETPLLVDPGGARDPRDHIRFSRDVPIGVAEAGARTIKELHLDSKERPALRRDRQRHIELVEHLLDSVRIAEDDALRDQAKLILKQRIGDREIFWSATQDLLADYFRKYPAMAAMLT